MSDWVPPEVNASGWGDGPIPGGDLTPPKSDPRLRKTMLALQRGDPPRHELHWAGEPIPEELKLSGRLGWKPPETDRVVPISTSNVPTKEPLQPSPNDPFALDTKSGDITGVRGAGEFALKGAMGFIGGPWTGLGQVLGKVAATGSFEGWEDAFLEGYAKAAPALELPTARALGGRVGGLVAEAKGSMEKAAYSKAISAGWSESSARKLEAVAGAYPEVLANLGGLFAGTKGITKPVGAKVASPKVELSAELAETAFERDFGERQGKGPGTEALKSVPGDRSSLAELPPEVRGGSPIAPWMAQAELFTFDPRRAAKDAVGDVKAFAGLRTSESVRTAEHIIGKGINDIMASDRLIAVNGDKMAKMVPDVKLRESISDALDTGQFDKLQGPQREVGLLLKKSFASTGEQAKAAGVINGLRENYISHIVDWKASKQTFSQELLDQINGTMQARGTTTASRFGKARAHETFEDLQQAIQGTGLVLRTKDPIEIYKTYSKSMAAAIINRQVIANLAKVTDGGGTPYMRKISERVPIRPGEVIVNAPGLRGYAVRKEIAPYVKFHFDQIEPSMLLRGVHGVTQAIKMFNVFGSLFHAKSLAEAAVMSIGPTELVKGALPGNPGMNAALKALREGGLGDDIDLGIRNGLTIEIPGEITRGVLTKTGALADRILAAGGVKTSLGEKTLGGIGKVVEDPFTKFTWDYLHAGLKPYDFITKLRKARLDHPNVPDEVLAKEIAPFVNSAYGGQNWYELATSFDNVFLKNIALGALDRRGRMAGQALLFALDWTTSAWRTATMVAGKGTGVPGIFKPLTSADHARVYQLRTALTYLTVVDTINKAVSGHHIWDPEQKDPTRIEFPDGTSIQPFKHAAEPVHWVKDPGKQLANKLAFGPKTAATWLFNLEYAGPFAPKMKDPSVGHKAVKTLESVLPFQVQTAIEAPPGKAAERAALGTLGFPEYGVPKTSRQQAIAERKKRAKELRDRSKP